MTGLFTVAIICGYVCTVTTLWMLLQRALGNKNVATSDLILAVLVTAFFDLIAGRYYHWW